MHLLGRFLFSLPFLILSIFHFRNGDRMTEMIPQWIPGGAAWVFITAVIYIYASTSILVLRQTRLACLLLGVALSLTVALIHFPNLLDPTLSDRAVTNLLKDMSLAGAAFYLAATLRPDRQRLPGLRRKKQ